MRNKRYRSIEYVAIHAKKIDKADIGPNKVNFDDQKYKTDEDRNYNLNRIMRSMVEIEKTPNGYSGTCLSLKENKMLDWEIDIKSMKVRGLTGVGEVAIRQIYTGNHSKDNRNYVQLLNSNISISKIIACCELLLSGYYVDNWKGLEVNHKDNSGGSIYRRNILGEEVLDASNLELGLLHNGKNNEHAKIWSRLYNVGIISSFSMYNSEFMESLKDTKPLNRATILKDYKNTIDPNTGIVYFD